MNQKRHQERYFRIAKHMRMRSHLRLTTLLIEMKSRTSLSDHKIENNMPEKKKRHSSFRPNWFFGLRQNNFAQSYPIRKSW